MFLFQRIEELSLHSDTKKNIAMFILQQKSKLGQYTMQEIAERTYTSKPTLVRFAKALGFSGWPMFMQSFLGEMHHHENHYSDIDPNMPFAQEDTTEDIIHKISSLQIESILDTADLIDIPALEKAVELLLAAKKIVLFGVSPNQLLAESFRRKMQTIGITVTIPLVDEGGIFSYALTADDCAILISYAANQDKREPMCFIRAMEENHVPLIGITGGGDNYIREHTDCVLTISSRERLFSKIAGFSTEASIASIFNILFSCCFTKHYQSNWSYKLANATVLENTRRATLADMRESAY